MACTLRLHITGLHITELHITGLHIAGIFINKRPMACLVNQTGIGAVWLARS